MRFSLESFTVALLLLFNTPAFAHPRPITDIQLQSREQVEARDVTDLSDLWKRKGGGGGGKGGGSSSSSSSSSSAGKGGSGSGSRYALSSSEREMAAVGSSTSSGGRISKRLVFSSISSFRSFGSFGGFRGGGGSRSGGGSKPNSNKYSSAGKGSSSSNAGGQTKTGSGVTPNYGGGRYYGGGATTPYTSGARSPLGLVAIPLAFGAGALAFYPGFWPYGAYAYPYNHPYTFRNHSANATNGTTTKREEEFQLIEARQSDTGVNETKPVTCLCAMYEECGCDDSGNTTFLDSLIGDGSYSGLNLSLVNVADINGTSTIVLNGTLPNGTTASGGTDDAFSAGARTVIEMSGYWVMVALVGMTVYFV
jgi:hypothetical protein